MPPRIFMERLSLSISGMARYRASMALDSGMERSSGCSMAHTSMPISWSLRSSMRASVRFRLKRSHEVTSRRLTSARCFFRYAIIFDHSGRLKSLALWSSRNSVETRMPSREQ